MRLVHSKRITFGSTEPSERVCGGANGTERDKCHHRNAADTQPTHTARVLAPDAVRPSADTSAAVAFWSEGDSDKSCQCYEFRDDAFH
jgi:hypothetical protein